MVVVQLCEPEDAHVVCQREDADTLLVCQTEERSRWMAQIVRVLEDIYKVAPLPPLYISSLTGTCTRMMHVHTNDAILLLTRDAETDVSQTWYVHTRHQHGM